MTHIPTGPDQTQQLSWLMYHGLYNDQTSECIMVKSGIGQGTIVGPVIFLIYVNDIVRMLPDIHINMYADDCIYIYIFFF